MKQSRLLRISIIAVLIAVSGYVFFKWFGKSDEADSSKSVSKEKQIVVPSEILENHPIETVKMQIEGEFEQVNLPGTVSYDLAKMARVGSRVAGRIVSIYVNEGDYVKKGQLIFSIQSVELGEMESLYRKSAARREALMLQAERAKELYEKKVTSAKEYELAMMDYKTVKTELETSRSALENYGLNTAEIESLLVGKSYSLHLPIRSPISVQLLKEMQS
jgi:cobalt-zinc-cadmium efflux system membrane fusion protein